MFIRFFTFFFMAMFLVGCCGDIDLKLSPVVKAWAPYSPNQPLIFQNQKGDTISFKVSIRNYNQHSNDKVCGNYAIETLETTLVAQADTSVQVKVDLSFEALVGIKVINKSHSNVNLNIQFNSVSKQYISHAFRDQYLEAMQVNGKTYRHVLHAYGNNTGGAFMAEIYYAKENGLIGFKDFSNNMYYLL